jgi:hypothetical protein
MDHYTDDAVYAPCLGKRTTGEDEEDEKNEGDDGPLRTLRAVTCRRVWFWLHESPKVLHAGLLCENAEGVGYFTS